MTPRKITASLTVTALLLAALAFSKLGPSSRAAVTGRPVANARINLLPGVIFWAWERPEDLRFLHPNQIAVAFLAKTIYLSSPRRRASASVPEHFIVRPRLQPLHVAPGTPLIAVVRIEISASSSPSATPAITSDQRETIASEISSLQNLPGVRAVQIDFDATTSQHAFYSALLQDVRRRLPASIPLSITALASWCIGDPWLSQLPAGTIDEAVPMLFRMGPDAATVANFLHSGEEFPVAACQASLGVSTDEPFSHQLLTEQLHGIPAAWHQKRIYIFAPRAWTQSVADSVLQEWQP